MSVFIKKLQLSPEEFLDKVSKFVKFWKFINKYNYVGKLNWWEFVAKGTLAEVRTIKQNGSIQFFREIKYLFSMGINCFMPGEIAGCHSFVTAQKRLTSILSMDFATVYEIKKKDFETSWKKNAKDL